MPALSDEFRITEDSAGAGHAIETELLRSLRDDLPQGENASFVLSARDAESRLAGGLTASTSYGWLLVKSLWVAPPYRRRSLGRMLLGRAEERARSIGCHGVWLDTSNPAAKDFYAGLGFIVFGKLENAPDQQPPSHRRWFMKKAL